MPQRHNSGPAGRRNRAEPSAPPARMMFDRLPVNFATNDPISLWGPPPRYSEAVGEDLGRCRRDASKIGKLPATTSHDRRFGSRERVSRISYVQPSTSGDQRLTSCTDASNSPRSQESERQRKSRPTQTRTVDQAVGGETQVDPERAVSQRTRLPNEKENAKKSSKIKKGLENMAFFIIQILD